MRILPRALLSAAALLLLTACTNPNAAGPPGPNVGSNAGPPGSAASSTAAPGTAAPSAPATAAPPPPPSASWAPGAQVPECQKWRWQPETKITGAQLAGCVAAGMKRAGSGAATTTVTADNKPSKSDASWESFGTADFRAQLTGSKNTIYVSTKACWVQLAGRGWVKGDSTNASDFDSVQAGRACARWLKTGSSQAISDTLQQAKQWQVAEKSTAPGVEAWRLQPTAPFTFETTTFTAFHLWLTRDGRLVQSDAATTNPTRNTNISYRDLGKKLNLKPPK